MPTRKCWQTPHRCSKVDLSSYTSHITTPYHIFSFSLLAHECTFCLYVIIVIEFYSFPSIVEIESNGTAFKSLKIDSVIDGGDWNKLILR